MGVLATWLTSQRTALAASPSSLTNLPEGVAIEDLPASKRHKAFVLRVAGVPEVKSLHGGGVVEYQTPVEVEVHWDPEVDLEAIHNTIADDLENVSHVMLKTSNRTAGVQLVWPAGGSLDIEDTNDFSATLAYTVTFRVTQDTT